MPNASATLLLIVGTACLVCAKHFGSRWSLPDWVIPDTVGRHYLLVGSYLELLPIVLSKPLNVSHILKIWLIALKYTMFGKVATVLLLCGLVNEDSWQSYSNFLALGKPSIRLSHLHLLSIILVWMVECGGILHWGTVMAAFLACTSIILYLLIFDMENIDFFVNLIILLVPLWALLRFRRSFLGSNAGTARVFLFVRWYLLILNFLNLIFVFLRVLIFLL